MTWTYSNNPQASQLDEIRVLCGDVDSASPLIEDEIVNYFLSTQGSVRAAALEACKFILHKFSMMGKGRLEGYEWDYTQLSAAMQARITDLQTGTSTLYAGGLSQAERTADYENQDLIPSRFYRGMTTNHTE